MESGKSEVVRLLIAKGAATDLKDMTGKVPVDLAKTVEIAHCFDQNSDPQPEESENLLVLSDPPKGQYLLQIPKPTTAAVHEPEAERSLERMVVVDLNRTFSFGNDTRRSQLLEWLIGFRLEGLLEVLIEAGFDDVDLLVSQVGSAMPLTLDNLETIGLAKPGHRARLLAAIEAEARHRSRSEAKPTPEPILSMFECCAKPIPASSFAVLPSFDDWLGRLGLKHLRASFDAAGYDDLESVLSLMRTRYALTEETLLKEMAVQPAATRQRLLLKLREDSARVDLYTKQPKGGEILLERAEKMVACRTCEVM